MKSNDHGPRVGRSVHWLLWIAAAFSMGGCSEPPVQTVHSLDAIVYGQVSDAAGTPVEGSRIFARQHHPGCSGRIVDEEARETTDAGGRYRLRFHTLAGRWEGACLLLHAEAGTWKSNPIQFEVEFRPENEQIDSVEVNVVLDGA